MHIDKYEGAFLWLAGVMMALFAAAVTISVLGLGIHLPGPVDQIAPADIANDPGFSNPGLREIRPGVYEVYVVASAWQYNPAEIEVPVGSKVTFYLTSADVIHGFKVFDTNVNVMVIPGQISEVSHTFNKPGTYQFYCHEYCGQLHHTMTGTITVTGDK
jgi:cytochrome c oxidase subunit II